MKRILVILILSANFVCAQNWVSLGTGLNDQSRVLYSDSVSGRIFVGGNFSFVNGRYQKTIAAWDGTEWDTLIAGINDGNPVLTITRYQNNIYAGGAFEFLYSSPYHGIVNGFTRWNGTTWDSLNIGFHNSGVPFNFYEYNNTLFCVGDFDSVGNCHSPYITSWDGNNFIPIGLPNGITCTSRVDACIEFQNELYFGASFFYNGTTTFSLIKWDGTNWNIIDTNFSGYITSMAVYNNELYIGSSGLYGVPANYLVKFDGTNFSSVGGDVNFIVYNLKVIENKLFVVGQFTQAGSILASRIAVWDGTNWSAFSNDTFNNAILDIAVFNNELYVTGGFNMINSDTINYIAKYNGWYLGEKELNKKSGVSIYPNPTNNVLNIQLSSQINKAELFIIDVLGNNAYYQTLNNINTSIDVSKLSDGVYFYRITNNKETYRGKIVIKN